MTMPPITPTLKVFISCLPVAPYRTQLTEQIEAYGQACREAALEEAAIDAEKNGHLWSDALAQVFFKLADRIRKLK